MEEISKFHSMQMIVYITTNYLNHYTNSKEKAVSASFWNVQKPQKGWKSMREFFFTNDSWLKHYDPQIWIILQCYKTMQDSKYILPKYCI